MSSTTTPTTIVPLADALGRVLNPCGGDVAVRREVGHVVDAQMDVVVGVGARAGIFLVGDVDAAGEAGVAVAHHDLAVGAVVGDRAQAPADTRPSPHSADIRLPMDCLLPGFVLCLSSAPRRSSGAAVLLGDALRAGW